MNLQPGQATLSVQPLPFWSQVRELPRHYLDALIDPTSMFAEGKRRASWSIIVFQLIGFFLLMVVIVTFFNLITLAVKGASTGQLGSAVTNFALRLLILIAIFLIHVATQFLVARGFRGTGSFREQLYLSLLIALPMGIVISIMSSATGLNFVFAAYALGLSVAAVRAVHNLSRNPAIISMLVPVILELAVYITLIVVGVIKLAPAGPV